MEIIQRRLLMKKKPQSGLPPKGYRRVAGIKSVDGAYIDLNLPFRDYPSFKGSFRTTEDTPDAFTVFGMRASNTDSKCILESTASTNNGTASAIRGRYGSNYMGTVNATRGEWHNFEIGCGYTIIDGEIITGTEFFYASDVSVVLFGLNHNRTIVPYSQAMGDFQAYTGREIPLIARALICCVRESDGEVGYYDINGSICPLTGTPFYINAGSGYFVTEGVEYLPPATVQVNLFHWFMKNGEVVGNKYVDNVATISNESQLDSSYTIVPLVGEITTDSTSGEATSVIVDSSNYQFTKILKYSSGGIYNDITLNGTTVTYTNSTATGHQGSITIDVYYVMNDTTTVEEE